MSVHVAYYAREVDGRTESTTVPRHLSKCGAVV